MKKDRYRGVMSFCSFVSDIYVFDVSVTVLRRGLSDASLNSLRDESAV